MREQAENLSKFDMKVTVEGVYIGLKLISPEAIKQAVELQPTKIDRQADERGIGKVMEEAFVNLKSDKTFQEHRKLYLTLLNLNSASCYIPLMIK